MWFGAKNLYSQYIGDLVESAYWGESRNVVVGHCFNNFKGKSFGPSPLPLPTPPPIPPDYCLQPHSIHSSHSSSPFPHLQSLTIPHASVMKNTKWVKIRSLVIALEIRPQLSSRARALGLRMKLLGAGVVGPPQLCEGG